MFGFHQSKPSVSLTIKGKKHTTICPPVNVGNRIRRVTTTQRRNGVDVLVWGYVTLPRTSKKARQTARAKMYLISRSR